MTTTNSIQPLSRTLLALGLALVGTAASFSLTTSPAQAQSQRTYYSVALQTPVSGARSEIIRGVLWKCEGEVCTAARDVSRPVNVCARLVKKIGPVASFRTPDGDLSAGDLTKCNAG